MKETKFKVIADFPWSIHKVGDIISTYKDVCRAYIVAVPDEYGESGKYDLRDYPHIYEQIIE